MSALDITETVRASMKETFADWWTDFEDDHSPDYPAAAVGAFVADLARQGYEIVKRGEVPNWMERAGSLDRQEGELHEYDPDCDCDPESCPICIPLYRVTE